MGVNAADIEEGRIRGGPDWRGSGATAKEDARLIEDSRSNAQDNAKTSKPVDPYSPDFNANVRRRMEEDEKRPQTQFRAAPRRSLISIIASKLGF